MPDQTAKDVEHLKAQIDGMSLVQSEIKECLTKISDSLAELTALRKLHDVHDNEIAKLREASHKHANMLQIHELKIETNEKLDDKVNKVIDDEVDMRIVVAKYSVYASLIASGITGVILIFIKGAIHP